MKLGDKIEHLRSLEGELRGLKRALSKSEMVRLIREEQDGSISVAYLSQLESGKRPHMTEATRELLAAFFKVHPGYLVSDPEGYDTQLTALPPPPEVRVDEWLEQGSDDFRSQDPELAEALERLAHHGRTRELLVLLARLTDSPALVDEMRQSVAAKPKPRRATSAKPKTKSPVRKKATTGREGSKK